MSVCRGARDLTFQYPCSCRFPPLREGNRDLVPPASRGNLKEGVSKNCRAMSFSRGGEGQGIKG
jgi:hypothetical protein